jgi:FkbM family methyltransferase
MQELSFTQLARLGLRKLTASRLARTLLRPLTMRGILPPAIWKRFPVDLAFDIALSGQAHFQYAADPSDAIGRALFWKGLSYWEAETIRVFIDLIASSTGFMDIGANTGVYSLLARALNPEINVIACEPVSYVFVRLCRNIELNGWSDQIHAVQEAMSNVIGESTLHVPFGKIPTSASLTKGGFRGMAGYQIAVETRTVDALLDDLQLRVDLVKIDVEGHEAKVLEGMMGLLGTSRPSLIVEVNPDGQHREIESILRSFDYRFFHLRDQGPVETATLIPDPREMYRNYLCLPGTSA